MSHRDCTVKGVMLHPYRHEKSGDRPCFAIFLWDGEGDPLKVWEGWIRKWGDEMMKVQIVEV
jgi:hypothetical protein